MRVVQPGGSCPARVLSPPQIGYSLRKNRFLIGHPLPRLSPPSRALPSFEIDRAYSTNARFQCQFLRWQVGLGQAGNRLSM